MHADTAIQLTAVAEQLPRAFLHESMEPWERRHQQQGPARGPQAWGPQAWGLATGLAAHSFSAVVTSSSEEDPESPSHRDTSTWEDNPGSQALTGKSLHSETPDEG